MQNRREFLKQSAKMIILANFFSLNSLFAKEEFKCAKKIIVYYSRSLNTHILSLYMKEFLGAEIFRLKTTEAYPKDYDEMVEKASFERKNKITPKLESLPNLKDYEIIFVGTPTWGLDIASPVRSFLAQSDLRAKFVIPFCTHAGWGFGSGKRTIKEICKDSKIIYPFANKAKFKEKTTRNLRSINENLIKNDNIFANLQDKKSIQKWLERF